MENKNKKKYFPKDAQEIVDKGTIDILIIQLKASNKTKQILDKADIILYESVEPKEVNRLREVVSKN